MVQFARTAKPISPVPSHISLPRTISPIPKVTTLPSPGCFVPHEPIQTPTSTILPSQKERNRHPRLHLFRGLIGHGTTGQDLQRKTTAPCLAAASSDTLSHLDESYPQLQLLTVLTFSKFKISVNFLFLHGFVFISS